MTTLDNVLVNDNRVERVLFSPAGIPTAELVAGSPATWTTVRSGGQWHGWPL